MSILQKYPKIKNQDLVGNLYHSPAGNAFFIKSERENEQLEVFFIDQEEAGLMPKSHLVDSEFSGTVTFDKTTNKIIETRLNKPNLDLLTDEIINNTILKFISRERGDDNFGYIYNIKVITNSFEKNYPYFLAMNENEIDGKPFAYYNDLLKQNEIIDFETKKRILIDYVKSAHIKRNNLPVLI